MSEYSYKDSGIQWMGKIPNHWDVKKLKRVLNEKLMYGANEVAELEDRSQPRYIRITDFDDNGNLREDTFKSLSYSVAENYLLTEGDILFARSGATVGKTFQFKNYDGLACFAGYLIKASPNIFKLNSDFLYYFTKSESYSSWKDMIFTQSTIQNIGADKYQYLEIPLPPIREQKAIADYLEKACAKIDQVIEMKKEQIRKIDEFFKSKIFEILNGSDLGDIEFSTSEFEWISKIPSTWEVFRLKHISSKINSGVTPKGGADVYVEEGVPIVRSQNITFERLDIEKAVKIPEEVHNSMSNSKLRRGDVLLNITGASLGRCNFFEYDIEANVNQHVCIIRPRFQVLTKFLFYLLNSEIGQAQIFSGFKGSGREGLNFEAIKNFRLPVPDTISQEKIIERLDKIADSVKKQKNLIELQITRLTNYRASLIHECVTGKKKVFDGEPESLKKFESRSSMS